jgi:fumarylacetoacetase
MLNHTHNPDASSWVASANHAEADFPLQNLPIAVARRALDPEPPRGMIAIGHEALDLRAVLAAGDSFLAAEPALRCAISLASQSSLNELMAAGPAVWQALRHGLFGWLHEDAPTEIRTMLRGCLVAQSELVFSLPARIGDYTDFYTSLDHAQNVAQVAGVPGPRGTNFEWLPIAYHGRASSVVVSGTGFHRPVGQARAPQATEPTVQASLRLDYELELGVFVGPGNRLGQPIAIGQADQQWFGMCMLNDWSARDIQFWEMAPLGPFLGKNFCTSISPWIVMAEALAPFRVPLQRPPGTASPLPYLSSPSVLEQGGIDIQLKVMLSSMRQRQQSIAPTVLSSTSFRHQFWTIAQMITQHTVNGCNLQPGDLIGTGTISGPTPAEAGAMIELARAGGTPIPIEGDGTRAFLHDGDQIIFRGWCERPGARRIGLGLCSGEVLPAVR